jgi:hypothetical protein
MWKMMLPKPRHLVLLVVGSLVVYGLIYFQMTTGEAYEYGRHFVMEDQRVTKLTGPQRDQRLNFWRGFSYSFGDKDGEASLTMRVTGERGEFNVPLALQKRQGRWAVVSAKAISEKGETFVIVE